MIQSALTFGAGVLTGQGLAACQASLPGCSLRGQEDAEASTFKLLLHVHGASVPELVEPGLVARPRPQLEVSLGKTSKESEFADFVQGSSKPSSAVFKAEEVPDCNWSFGDSLTFAVRIRDVLSGGMRFRLSARTDFCIGPVQINLPKAQDLGEGMLDLRERVLPECRLSSQNSPQDGKTAPTGCGGIAGSIWQSPAIVVPLTRVWSDRPLAPVARVVVSVSVYTDPQDILQDARDAQMSLVGKVVDPFVRCMDLPACGKTQSCRLGRFCQKDSSRMPYQHVLNEEPESEASPASDYNTCEVPPSLSVGSRRDACIENEGWADALQPKALFEAVKPPGLADVPPQAGGEQLCTSGMRGRPMRPQGPLQAQHSLASPQAARYMPRRH